MQPGNGVFSIKTLDFDHFHKENIEKMVLFEKVAGKI